MLPTKLLTKHCLDKNELLTTLGALQACYRPEELNAVPLFLNEG